MSLGRGIVAVAVPAHLAPHVASELKRRDADGPAMAVSDFLPRWLYLAEHEGIVVDSDTLPAGVMVFDCPSTIQLPAVDTHVDQLRWVVPPDPQRRWLPTLAAVLCAVGSRARFACRQRPERRPQLDIPEEGIGYA